MDRRRFPPGFASPRSVVSIAVAAVVVLAIAMAPTGTAASGRDSTPPTMPGHLMVAGVTQTSVTITWQPGIDDVGVVGYEVLWNTRRRRDAERTIETTYTKTGLQCGSSYTVTVAAVDDARNVTDPPAEAVVATGACIDSTPPSQPQGLTQVARTETTATLSWSASTDDVGVAGYVVSRAGVPVGNSSATTYTLTGLSCGSAYSAVVQAFDPTGNRSTPASYTGTTAPCSDRTAPTAPTALKQVSHSTTSISLSWSPSSDSSGIAGYGVYVDGSKVTTSSGPSATVSGLACGKSYTVAVDAADPSGNVSSRASAGMQTGACPTPTGPTGDKVPPTTPTNLAVTSLSLGSATVKWSPSSDNVGVVGYTVYHGSTAAGDTPGTSFVVPSVTCGTTAQIGVEARDAAGNRSPRTTLLVGTHPCADAAPPTTPGTLVLQNRTETSITVNWAVSTDNTGVVGYGVYRDGQRLETVGPNSYTFAGLTCGKSFTLGVDAVDGSGLRSPVSLSLFSTLPCSDAVAPTMPSSLTVTSPSQTAVTLSWTASTDAGGVLGYDVYVDGVKKATTPGLVTALGALQCGNTMTLGVEAFDKSGNRSQRATTTATTLACTATPSGGTLFVAPGGSDSATCASSAPCASFDRAYQLAKPGQVVQVAGGSYPSQVIWNRAAMRNLSPGCEPSNTINCVAFRPTPGAQVTINGVLEVRGSSVWIDGATSGGPASESRSYNIKVTGYADTEADSETNYPDHVILEGIDATNFGVFNVDTVTFKDMDVGPATVTSGCAILQGPGYENKIGFGSGVTYVPRNITIDGVVIHDQNVNSAGRANDCHFGGLFIVNADGLTIKNSIFSQNVVYNIQIQNFAGPPPKNVTMENNWFGCPVEWLDVSPTKCDGQPDVQFNAASTFTNYLFRYNSFAGGLGQMVGGASYSNVRVVANAGSGPTQCFAGWSFGYNAWDGAGCASTDVNLGSLPFVDPRAGQENFRLAPGSRAIDHVTPTASEYLMGSDIAGVARPLGLARDAGASETG